MIRDISQMQFKKFKILIARQTVLEVVNSQSQKYITKAFEAGCVRHLNTLFYFSHSVYCDLSLFLKLGVISISGPLLSPSEPMTV